jgi:hypothetical protein
MLVKAPLDDVKQVDTGFDRYQARHDDRDRHFQAEKENIEPRLELVQRHGEQKGSFPHARPGADEGNFAPAQTTEHLIVGGEARRNKVALVRLFKPLFKFHHGGGGRYKFWFIIQGH